MAIKTKKLIIFAGIIFAFFLNAGFVFATEVKYPPVLGMSLDSNSSFPEYAKYFYNIGIVLAGLLAVAVVTYGGIYWLVSFGRGKFTDEGKEWVKAGMLGLILIFSSYLIVYTINPNLVIFKLDELPGLSFLANQSNQPQSSLPVVTYEEIPIGIITENLLSRPMDCYNFDGNGDPIDGAQIKDDDGKNILGPTYLSHDRVNCSLKLAEALDKKSQTAKNLSDKITELMNQCSCGGTFTFTGAETTTEGASGTSSSTTCINKTCAKSGSDCVYPPSSVCDETTLGFNGLSDLCKDTCQNTGCAAQSQNSQCCPAGVKEKIEHGPISMADCNNTNKDFKGLDEFRSQYHNSYEEIKAKVEITPAPKVGGQEISIINSGSCAVCVDNCASATGKKLQECQDNLAKCKQNYQNCLKKSPWHNLRLIDQLTYLKGRMDEIKSNVQQDLSQLKTAESSLDNCYLADTYIDFLKAYQQNNKKETIILLEKNFSDPKTQEPISPSKYCKGFEYNNSSCYSQCQKICPGTSSSEADCYSGIKKCEAGDEKCLANQAVLVKNCYDKRKCLPNDGNFKTFQDCFADCKNQCLTSCDNLCNPEEKTKCQNNCNGNSQCLLDNEDKCLVNFNQLKECTDSSDCQKQCDGNEDCINACQKQCSDSSALCKYCSDQYAGYTDCVEPQYATDYFSSSLYKNPYTQKCPSAYEPPPAGSACYTSSSAASATPCDCGPGKAPDIKCCKTACVNLCPQTTKCPASSKCPLCPCDMTNEFGDSTSGGGSSNGGSGGNGSGGGSGGGEGCQMQTCTNPDGTTYQSCYCSSTFNNIKNFFINIFASVAFAQETTTYRVCSANCEEYAYNDDPLTFYCQNEWWWKDEASATTPIGQDMIAPEKREIPVGQTIDDAEKWAQDFMDNLDDFTKKTQDMIQYIKGIAEEKNYCECGSKCDSAGKEPACKAECIFSQIENPNPMDTNPYMCFCSRSQCTGNPCQKMINLFEGKTADQNCPKGTAFMGVEYYQKQIGQALSNFKSFVAQQSRSDVVKELEYSRKATSECSVIQNNYGKETRLLSCTRVMEEQISPYIDKKHEVIINGETLKSACYGIKAGKIMKNPATLADNWYCVENRQPAQQ